MLLARIREGIFGTLVVAVSGESLERFINSVHRRGIVMGDILIRGPQQASFKISPSDFHRLRPAVRHSGVRLKILRKAGLPFQLRQIGRRKGALAGVVAACAIIYLLSSFVWFIDVHGNKKLSRQQIIQVAQSSGVRTGIWRSRVDPGRLARDLKEKIPQTAWVGVSVQGTRVLIEVVEKVEKPAPLEGKGNLLASKTGLVTDVLVLKGVPQVKEGEMVKTGQPLIVAENIPAAQGFVRARIWYTGSGMAKLKDEGLKPTGRSSSGVRIKIGAKVIILTGKQSPFPLFKEAVDTKSLPKWRNISLPVEFITVRYEEMTHYTNVMSKEEALKSAEEQAKADLQAKLPAGVKVLHQRVHPGPEKDPNIVRFNIDVETLEDIAVHQQA